MTYYTSIRYLEYRGISGEDQNVGVRLPVIKVKGVPVHSVQTRRPTRVVGDDRRTGNNKKRPHRLVVMEDDGEVNHHRWEYMEVFRGFRK
jgi:hypothetical protein